MAGGLQGVAETVGGRQRIEQVDQESGEEGVHLLVRLLELRRSRIGGEPVSRPLLVRTKPRRCRPEAVVEVLAAGRRCGHWYHRHGQLALRQVISLSLLGGPGEGGQMVLAGSEAGRAERDAPAGGAPLMQRSA